MDLPRRFGPYTLLRQLSRGGMGDVFLARAGGIAGAERLSVVKTLRTELAQDNEYLTRFIDEACVAVTLNHAGVCHVFDAGRVGDVLYLAMEYIAGLNVASLLAELQTRGRALPPAYGVYIALELLEALDYAHHHKHPETGAALGIVHRDVSPQNVMVSFEGEVKLIDFGLATTSAKTHITVEGSVMGKLAYMSPEQAHGTNVDARTDQFSAAIVAYELLVGERFYGTMTRGDVMNVVAVGGFLPEHMAAVDDDVRPILQRALASEPADRWPSCAAMASALRLVLAKKHPLMGRPLLKSFLDDVMPGLAEEHRVKLRELPPAVVSEPTREPTQSFTAQKGRAPDSTISGAVDAISDTSATVLVHDLKRSSKQRRNTRIAALSSVVVVVAAVSAIAFVTHTSPSTVPPPSPPVTTSIVAPPPSPLALPATTVPTTTTQATTIAAPEPTPTPIEAPTPTHAKRTHAIAVKNDAHAPPTPTPTPTPTTATTTTATTTTTTTSAEGADDALSKIPFERRKDIVLKCDVPRCNKVKEWLSAGQRVADPALNSCVRACGD